MKLHGHSKKLDELHLEYEDLLLQEIESLIGIAAVHGWQSRLYMAGKHARRRLKKAGSAIKLPDGEK